jgi:hypothetical protein
MQKKSSINEADRHLLERLNQRPDLKSRIEAILELAESEGGELRTADQIEELLIEELRRLGNQTMEDWARGAHDRVAAEMKKKDPSCYPGKKKTLKWWCVFGLVEVQESIWRSPTSSYLRVFADRIGVTNRGRSRRLERALTDFGSEHSFAKANFRLAEHYGFSLNTSAIRRTTLEHAERAKAQMEGAYRESFRALPAKGAEHLLAEADGTMICTVSKSCRKQKRPREWKEMRLVAARAQGRVESTYGATFGGVEMTGRRWGHCAREAGWSLQSQIHVVADGAEWIRHQSRETFGDQENFLLDYYHVSEYLAAAAEFCRPKAPNCWRKIQQKRLKRGALESILKELDEHQEAPAVPDEQAPVRAARRYLGNRLDQLDYPRALRLDLPIGSGLIESGNRHVLQARLKQPGTAWLADNADAIAQLRVLRSNGHWLHLWN